MARWLLALPIVLSVMALPAAAELPVDLELVLAVDVSRSVDTAEATLQRTGYIRAFQDPEVIRAIRSGFLRRIAVTYVEWAGFGRNRVVAGWTLIDGAGSAHAFAKTLGVMPPISAMRTSISGAIDYALPLFADNGYQGTRRAIDISGDGPNNAGGLVNRARDRAVAAGIIINGLPILDGSQSVVSFYDIANLDLYYRDCVIGGPGAIMEVAADFEDFARAIRRKLILEIAGTPPRLVLAQLSPEPRVSPPCNIGEKMRRAREDDD